MRRQTILLGLLTSMAMILFASGRALPTESDTGFNPGEKIPSIVVGGEDLSEYLRDDAEAILVVWSVEDATSRVVNSWISHSQPEGRRPIPIYSICLDADQQDADIYAKLDNAHPQITLWGAEREGEKQSRDLRLLASKGPGQVFYTTYGKIEQKVTATEMLAIIQ